MTFRPLDTHVPLSAFNYVHLSLIQLQLCPTQAKQINIIDSQVIFEVIKTNEGGRFFIKQDHHCILFSDKTINTKYRLLQIITFEPYMKESMYILCKWFILNNFYEYKSSSSQNTCVKISLTHELINVAHLQKEAIFILENKKR